MTGNLSGRVAVVTGSSRGIGRAVAVRLAERGAAVVVSYLKNDGPAGEVVEQIEAGGGKAIAVRADLSVPANVTHLFDRAEHEFGSIDIVVANAADAIVKPLVDCTEGDFDHLFAANVKSVFFTLKEAALRMRDGGRIVVTSTGGTKMFFTETSLYLGSKGAIEQFVRVLSRELGPRGITVNALSPGFTDTDLLPARDREVAADMSPFGRIGTPGDIADVAAFLASPDARWITGQNIGAGGGVF
ncbi:SDR family oxidoreductase [Nocardia sp. ET3-3]|uniref:SDR family oxidoreductase n=1 Tax=Nocardia terrae TaxID=2675851 RepID=A0A7K1UTG9_9NOCA|nr:SDR family oxidoreductase [Nocardia terrae]MVU77647.1 SDR family oxidoreductase [Nocardia terrae]